ncbi:uncharacterized protein LOC125500298 isoform X1 [Athalia rosae]|uniref:uncharacterized protein LOC125500298 isoform X1 n=1 Tax=Athalia rosae TaxID=37344 RepID=UPI00203358AA|nr:uncharacterized protein LOC125500298 isoform X1 [Athalia rosae]
MSLFSMNIKSCLNVGIHYSIKTKCYSIFRYKADCFSRSDGVMFTPTQIQLEATIVQPKLFNKITEDDRTFQILTSSSQKEMKENRKYVFYNNTGEPMFINAQSTNPFQVLTLCTSKTTINPLESDGICVTPGHSVEVNLICVVDADCIYQAMESHKCKDTDTSFIDMEKNLLIQHIGTCNQVLPLYLRIYLPLLKLSTCQINFGLVYIGETKQVQLSIENVSSM